MKQKDTNTCPVCHGEKVIEGICECNEEWRGTQRQSDNEWDDCKCTPELGCTNCNGTGLVEPDQKN
nr:ankyrin [Desulfobulbaceae bacterium]